MSDPDKTANQLDQLIDSSRQDAQAQQARVEELTAQSVKSSRAQQILALAVLALFAAVLIYQYPRFSEPYARPDPVTNAAAAEGDLLEVVGRIEVFRLTTGRYPAVLSEVSLPEGLSALIASTALTYTPTDSTYQLDWTFPHWRATYESQTEAVSVTPLGKH